jgi:hypothetical protein
MPCSLWYEQTFVLKIILTLFYTGFFLDINKKILRNRLCVLYFYLYLLNEY